MVNALPVEAVRTARKRTERGGYSRKTPEGDPSFRGLFLPSIKYYEYPKSIYMSS